MTSISHSIHASLARLVAGQLGRLGFVESVYARRSVASGESILGRSDLDLTVVLKRAAEAGEEVERLCALARRITALQRVLPILGPPEVATADELRLWYRSPRYPACPERDRGWLRLWGDPFERPPVDGSCAERRRQNLPWFFWCWMSLPNHHRRGRVRTCCNLVLDMVNVRALVAGSIRRPMRREALLVLWENEVGRSAATDAIARVLRGRRSRSAKELLRWIYRQSLLLTDALAAELAPGLPDSIPATQVRTRVPFAYGERIYRIVDPRSRGEVDRALEQMESEPRILITSARGLAAYFRHRNPWEHATIEEERVREALPVPRENDFRAAIAYYLHRVVPRRIGLALGTGVDRTATIGPQYAQARLWLEQGVVAADRDDLIRRCELAHGAWPYRPARTREEFFRREYPRLCDSIDALAEQVGQGDETK